MQGLATAFVEVFRRMPPLVLQIYWAYYVFAGNPPTSGFSAFTTALIGGLQHFGIQFGNLPRRHRLNPPRAVNTGLAVGMESISGDALRGSATQAIRRVLPSPASTWVSLFKDTSLVSVIAVADLFTLPSGCARHLSDPRGC